MTTGRCPWAEGARELDRRYHDEEWGVPHRDDRALFELLVLEGAQAGLSWSTILAKRERYREAFAGFDLAAVAAFDERRVEELLADPGIIRHRGKIEAAIGNARACLALAEEHGSLAACLWRFVDGRPLQNAWREQREVPASTPLSERMSSELRRAGLRFVGPTIVYAFLQAAGLVNDHLVTCFRHPEVAALG